MWRVEVEREDVGKLRRGSHLLGGNKSLLRVEEDKMLKTMILGL